MAKTLELVVAGAGQEGLLALVGLLRESLNDQHSQVVTLRAERRIDTRDSNERTNLLSVSLVGAQRALDATAAEALKTHAGGPKPASGAAEVVMAPQAPVTRDPNCGLPVNVAERIRQIAQAQFAASDGVEFDGAAPISYSTEQEGGTYVQAWVWVEFDHAEVIGAGPDEPDSQEGPGFEASAA
jgi:hypothetical protein